MSESNSKAVSYDSKSRSANDTQSNIEILEKRQHLKASEAYVDVIFRYPKNNYTWKGSVPVEYRRTGTHAKSKEEIEEVVKRAYDAMDPEKREGWLKEQEEFWKQRHHGAEITKSFFDELKDSDLKCVNCQLPKNPNWARRIQDIKEFGYTLATNTKVFCKNCNKNTTQLVLLRLPRSSETGYESWSPELRKKILEVLDYHDAYENRKRKNLLPDHKFPEIRWDKSTREENPEDMSDDEMRRKFQLLDNQRNEQKREVCRRCFQKGLRGTPFGINFFYKGDERWPENVPRRGKAAIEGCIGCGWYDLDIWREEINKSIFRLGKKHHEA